MEASGIVAAGASAAAPSSALAPLPTTQAQIDLQAVWHPPMAATAEVLFDLATAVDAAKAVEGATAEGLDGASDAMLAYRLDLAAAVVTLSEARPQVDEALDRKFELFFECPFPYDEPSREGDEMGADVQHAAVGCALVKKVDFRDNRYLGGPDIQHLFWKAPPEAPSTLCGAS